MGKANWFYSARDNKWVLLGKGGTQIAAFGDDGLADIQNSLLVRGAGTLQNLNVGTLATIQRVVVQVQATIQTLNVGTLATLRAAVVSAQGTIQDLRVPTLANVQALNVNAQGSVQNLNVGTLATIQAAVIAGQGTIRDLNVPTLATLRSVDVTGVASIAGCDIGSLNVSGRFRIGGGTRFTALERLVGTTEGIAAIGSGLSVWGTFAGSLNTVDETSTIFASPRSNIAGKLGFGPFRCPTAGLVNVLIGNYAPDSAGSLPADIVWDVFVLKAGV